MHFNEDRTINGLSLKHTV